MDAMKIEQKLQIAKKRLKDWKADKEKIGSYILEILKQIYENNWVKSENEIQEVKKCYRKNEVVIYENNVNIRRCEICNVEVHKAPYVNILEVKNISKISKRMIWLCQNRYSKKLLKMKLKKYKILNHWNT